MTRVCFVVGHEDRYDSQGALASPSDTPEAYWRVALPAQHLGATAAILGHRGAEERALAADVIWIHQPTSEVAASLAEVGRCKGRAVIVDFSEDPWLREYSDARLAGMERVLEAASLIVVANECLVDVFRGFSAPLQVIRPVIPLGPGWLPKPPVSPPLLSWWCDGRQRRGFEDVAPALRRVLDETDVRLAQIQFAHMRPLVTGLETKAAASMSARFHSYFADDQNLTAEGNMAIFRAALAPAALHMECYPISQYRETVSDLPLLRAAALGVPSITTRSQAPPGALSSPPDEWADTILSVLQDPDKRRGLSLSARAWAETRSGFDAYQATIEEVL